MICNLTNTKHLSLCDEDEGCVVWPSLENLS